MKKFSLVVILFVLLSLVLASPALATSPTTDTGWAEFVSSSPPEIRTANGNTFITETDVFNLFGVIEGVYTSEAVTKIKPDGSIVIRAKAVCDPCTVDGLSGKVIFRASYHDDIGFYSVVKGYGDLARLHGQGSIDLTTFIITFNYHFD